MPLIQERRRDFEFRQRNNCLSFRRRDRRTDWPSVKRGIEGEIYVDIKFKQRNNMPLSFRRERETLNSGRGISFRMRDRRRHRPVRQEKDRS